MFRFVEDVPDINLKNYRCVSKQILKPSNRFTNGRLKEVFKFHSVTVFLPWDNYKFCQTVSKLVSCGEDYFTSSIIDRETGDEKEDTFPIPMIEQQVAFTTATIHYPEPIAALRPSLKFYPSLIFMIINTTNTTLSRSEGQKGRNKRVQDGLRTFLLGFFGRNPTMEPKYRIKHTYVDPKLYNLRDQQISLFEPARKLP